MWVLKAGALYFAMVFVAAFAFGTVRTLLLEPALGETVAVAIETPFLVIVMFLAARLVLRRVGVARTVGALLPVGLFGLLLQQIAEFALVLAAGETIAQHIAYLQTPAGLIYLAALAVFVLMPLLVAQTKSADR